VADIIEKIEALPNGRITEVTTDTTYIGVECIPTDELKALTARLREAEAVIEHYADESNWAHANCDYTHHCAPEGCPRDQYYSDGNGYDKAQAYLKEYRNEEP
jgi:hypothetical protein